MAIVHHVVSAGGVERMVNALISAISELPEANDWEFTILTAAKNSAGNDIRIEQAFPKSIHVYPLTEDGAGGLIDNMLEGSRLFGIRGTGRVVRLLGQFLHRVRSRWFEGGLSPVRREIEAVLRSKQFDVAYFPYPYLIRPPAVTVPMVGTFHDFNHLHTASLDRSMRIRIERQLGKWLKACVRVVVSAEFIRNELSSLYPASIEKSRLIRLSFPFPDHSPTTAQLRTFAEKRALPNTFLLTTGWVVPHKNQAVAFKAISDSKDSDGDLALVCVGPNSHELRPGAKHPSPYVEEILNIVEAGGLVHGVDYLALGFVDDFELQCLYKLAKAVVIPAIYEAGSFTGAEAMRAGCPVIFSRTAANLEQAALVDDQAWFFNPSDPGDLLKVLQEISDDPELTMKICKRAAEKVTNNLSWERTASQYLSVFDEARVDLKTNPL